MAHLAFWATWATLTDKQKRERGNKMIEKLNAHLYKDTADMFEDCREKINELVNAVNELQKRIDPPSVYEVMKEKDEIIARHIGKKNQLQKALDVAVGALKLFDSGQYTPEADAYGLKTDASRVARQALEQINEIKGGK